MYMYIYIYTYYPKNKFLNLKQSSTPQTGEIHGAPNDAKFLWTNRKPPMPWIPLFISVSSAWWTQAASMKQVSIGLQRGQYGESIKPTSVRRYPKSSPKVPMDKLLKTFLCQEHIWGAWAKYLRDKVRRQVLFLRVQHLDIKKNSSGQHRCRKESQTELKRSKLQQSKWVPSVDPLCFSKSLQVSEEPKDQSDARSHFASTATELWTTLQRPRCAKWRCPRYLHWSVWSNLGPTWISDFRLAWYDLLVKTGIVLSKLFPTCQVRLVRFYDRCSPPPPPPPPPHPPPPSPPPPSPPASPPPPLHPLPCSLPPCQLFAKLFTNFRTQWALLDLNCKGLSALGTAGPQPGTFRAQWAPLDLNLKPSKLSEHHWTATWDPPSSVSTAGPQPGTLRAQWAPLDLNLGPSELSEHRWTSTAR